MIPAGCNYANNSCRYSVVTHGPLGHWALINFGNNNQTWFSYEWLPKVTFIPTSLHCIHGKHCGINNRQSSDYTLQEHFSSPCNDLRSNLFSIHVAHAHLS